jgi:hypothetical protein
VHAGGIEPENPRAMHIALSFALAFRALTPAGVRDELLGLFDDVLLLPVTREPPATDDLSPEARETVKELLSACEEGFCEGKYAPDQKYVRLSGDWEQMVRTLLAEPSVKEYLQGLRVPYEQQMGTLAESIKDAIAKKNDAGDAEPMCCTARRLRGLSTASFGAGRGLSDVPDRGRGRGRAFSGGSSGFNAGRGEGFSPGRGDGGVVDGRGRGKGGFWGSGVRRKADSERW